MPPFDPLLWRLAGRLAAHITKVSHRTLDIDLAPRSMEAARQLLDQLHAATERGWHSAAENLSRQLRSRLTECQMSINAGLKATSAGAPWQSPPTQRLVYDELMAVRTDFAEFSFDLPDETVTVFTDEITLEDIYLGRFEIRLQGRELGGTPYIIIPESPHYPSSRSDVPHPHVLGERLCEGDASAPLAHALRTGRFSDYFQIIQQTLASYNSESPYVSLDAWDGADCHACGGHASDDDSYYCEGCDANVCSDCSRSCRHCGCSGCDACSQSCPDCSDDCCSSCLKRCEGCSKLRCPDCLTNQLCEACHAEAATNPDTDEEAADEETSNPVSTLSPDAPLSPDRVAKLLFLRDLGETEVGGFGISAADDLLLIEDFVLVRQHCSVVTVAFEDEAVAEFFDRQIDLGRKPEQFGRIWIHTHPGESAQPSSVDEETFARVFGRSDWAVMTIVACGGDTFARLQFPAGPGGSLNLPFAVDYRQPFTGSDHEAWTNEYLAAVLPEPDLIFSESPCHSIPSHVAGSSRTYSPLELARWPEW